MATAIGTGIATAETCIDKTMKKAGYLCCFKYYVEDYEQEKSRLEATRDKEAYVLINVDAEAKKERFGFLTDCIWQYKRGKELARKTLDISKLMERRNNLRLVRPIGMEYSSRFIHFESRKTKFEQLKEVLKNSNGGLVGLHGMGGTGKTTMAIEVGKELKESNLFDKVIFIVVSNPPDLKRIQDSIFRHLCLPLEEGKESERDAESLRRRIVYGRGRLLIILDDVWQALNLKDIGIPLGFHQKGQCSVLLTTRDLGVCKKMGCQNTIYIELLSKEDALNLFLLHAGKSVDSSSTDMKNIALNIVKECRGLPVAIVAIAKALKSAPLKDWKAALIRLQNIDEDFPKVYQALRLSYDNLKNEQVKELFLLCSLFPEDFEIPIELLYRIAIGSGLCGEVRKYYIARSEMFSMENLLLESGLLLKAEKECVRMHDLVRDLALRIASEENNVRCSSWIIDSFPSDFDGRKLEILLVWIKANGSLEFPDALFEGMKRLRVLFLICTDESSRIPTPSFLQSFHSLKNIRTLLLTNWELGDISITGSLRSLETLELNNCSITELPIEVAQLAKLRLLGLRNCNIEEKNPFNVIQRCLQLEELYYVKNDDILHRGNRDEELAQVTLPPALERYHIIDSHFPNSLEVDASTSTCFKSTYLKEIFSESTIRYILAYAEILELGKYYEKAGCRNLIPDIVPTEDGGMEFLIKLSLHDWYEIECLILTDHLQSGVSIFSRLAELKLCNVAVKELCSGRLPIDFLKQLEQIDLRRCLKLESILFKRNFDLGMLMSIKLVQCSMTSVFHPSTAQSLKHLEILSICECPQLQYIITMYEGSGEEIVDEYDPHGRTDDSIFPKLKFLNVQSCVNLKFVLPISLVEGLSLLEELRIVDCYEIKYIFDQHSVEMGLYQMRKEIILPSLKVMEISGMPDFIYIFPAECYHPTSSVMQNSSPKSSRDKDPSPTNTFSWTPLCCFLPKSSVSKANLMEMKTEVFNPAECFLRPPFDPHNMRKIKITHCSKFKWLFTLSFASSMSLLEKLEVGECHELEHIFRDVGDDDDHRNYSFVFPRLQEVYIWKCHLLESLFPASHFKTLDYLKSLRISGTPKLKYVLGKCSCDVNLPQPTHPTQGSRQDVVQSKQEEANEVDEEELEMQKQDSSSPPTEGTKPSANNMVEHVPFSDLPAMATPSSSSDMLGAIPQKLPSHNNEVSIGEGPSTSSTHSESDISHPGSLTFTKELLEKKSLGDGEAFQRVDKPFVNEAEEVKEPINEFSSPINSHSVPKKPQTVTSATHTEPRSSHPNLSSPQSGNQTETIIDEEVKVDHISHQQFGDNDVNRLFCLMEKGADIRVCMSHVSKKIADNEVTKAFADLEVSLKMSLQEIATSEENSLRLENALNFLSTHYFDDEASPSELKSTIQSLHQEIPSILSSFKHVSASKEKEIKDCEIKLSSLQEQRKKSVSETKEFRQDFEFVKKEMSKIVEDNLKERQELEKWSSCVLKWWKATLL
ncbi:putative disease resistance protein [Senna tora]|uniref:Putative disease resistance protein n=1 Tax=Senna tora TaxID=362788 RepID=A0A834XEH2_9FABA|nr:putative disease resistance protein [Senna tora]